MQPFISSPGSDHPERSNGFQRLASGRPLEDPIRQRFEKSFGTSFAAVRIHDDGEADEAAGRLSALAYVTGADIVFRRGHFNPGTSLGDRLLAHELAHVVQGMSPGLEADEPTLEQEARKSASMVSADTPGHPAIRLSASGGRRPLRNDAGASPTGGTTTSLPAIATTAPTPALSLDELEARIRLIDAQLSRLGASWVSDPDGAFAIKLSQDALATERRTLKGGSADAGAIVQAQAVLDRVERAIDLLNAQRMSIKGAEYTGEIDRVRKLYFTAMAHIFMADVVDRYSAAETAAQGLPRALLEVDLKRYETHGHLNESVLTYSKDLVAWVQSTRTALDALQTAANDLKAARLAHAPDVPAKEKRFRDEADLLQVTIEALALFDFALRAHEEALKASKNPFDWPIAGATGRLVQRVEKMKAASERNDIADLKARLNSFKADPDVARFYKAMPAMIAAAGLVARLGIVLVATVVSAGVGGLVGGGATATATAGGGVTVGGALAFAGTAALEALTFTVVSQGLSTVVLGDPITAKGFLTDLAWNMGLFGAMRGLALGVGRGLAGTGLEMLKGPVTLTSSFPVLMGYGVLRFRIEQGHWPSDEELDAMTAQTLLMLVAVTVTTAAVQRWLPGGGRRGALETFRAKYGLELGTLEAGRRDLAQRLGALIDAGVPQTDPRVADLEAKARALENQVRDLLDKAQADPAIDMNRIRAELKAARAAGMRVASELLAVELGVPVEAALRPAGERSFTYAWGKTNDLEARLRAAGAKVIKPPPDPRTGARTLVAQFGTDAPLTFEERSAPGYGFREVFVDPDAPAIQRLFTDQAINDPGARRTALRMIASQLARNPAVTVDAATRVVSRDLRARLRAAPPGTNVETLLIDLRTRGIEVSGAPAALVAQARALEAAGILRSAEWLAARTQDQFVGVIGEWLAMAVVERGAAPGTTVYRNVHFVGDLFTDAAGTKPHMLPSGRPAVNVDVAELDFMVGNAGGPIVDVLSIANVKAVRGAGGDAASQNQNALNALRGHSAGTLAQVRSGGRVLYARVTSVVATNANTGADVTLSSAVREIAGGAHAETVGPQGARGYSSHMGLDATQIQQLVAILRDMQVVGAGGY